VKTTATMMDETSSMLITAPVPHAISKKPRANWWTPRTSRMPLSSSREALRMFFLSEASRVNAIRCDAMTMTHKAETSAREPERTYSTRPKACDQCSSSSTVSSASPLRKAMEEPASKVACVEILFRISMRCPIRKVSTSIIVLAF
jgi:hypothetical protein